MEIEYIVTDAPHAKEKGGEPRKTIVSVVDLFQKRHVN
jgi:hypothetical protein